MRPSFGWVFFYRGELPTHADFKWSHRRNLEEETMHGVCDLIFDLLESHASELPNPPPPMPPPMPPAPDAPTVPDEPPPLEEPPELMN